MAMDLCTLLSVKRLLDIKDQQTTNDDLLQLIVAGVSRQIEVWLNRTVLSGSYTEYFDVEDGVMRFSVAAYPVTAVTSVVNAPDRQWSSGTTISATYIDYGSPYGVINLYSTALAVGHNALRIVYTGGMAADTETFQVGDYADISMAAAMQAASVFNRRRTLGMLSAGVSSQSVSPSSEGLLDDVVKILAPHRRLTHV